MIRVPRYQISARGDSRAGVAGMNLYLGLAGLLAFGLNRIKEKIKFNEPISKNSDLLPENEGKQLLIKPLPTNLEESLRAFEDSKFISGIFREQFVEKYHSIKREELLKY